jgi:hypothetical protein
MCSNCAGDYENPGSGSKSLSLRDVAEKALEILEAHERAADADAGFDAGEFSGPAHVRMADEEITILAEKNGFTYEDVRDEFTKMSYENTPDCPEDTASPSPEKLCSVEGCQNPGTKTCLACQQKFCEGHVHFPHLHPINKDPKFGETL